MDIYELRSYTRIRGTVHYLSARLERDPETGRIEGQTHTGRSFLDAHLINGDNTELSALLIPSFKSDLTQAALFLTRQEPIRHPTPYQDPFEGRYKGKLNECRTPDDIIQDWDGPIIGTTPTVREWEVVAVIKRIS
mgnify:CR=1 FL=1|jgi:hypothetical protein